MATIKSIRNAIYENLRTAEYDKYYSKRLLRENDHPNDWIKRRAAEAIARADYAEVFATEVLMATGMSHEKARTAICEISKECKASAEERINATRKDA